MKKHILVLLFVVSGFLTACGGGSSSSGGGSSTTGTSPTAPVSDDGTYGGSQTLTLSAAGVAPETDTVGFVLQVTGDQVSILDGDFTATTTLDNGTFSADSGPLSVFDAETGITCNGSLLYAGSVANGQTNGNVAGNLTCSIAGNSTRVTIAINGTFTGTLGAPADGGSAFGVMGSMM